MIFDTLKYSERCVKSQYTFEELTVSACLENGDDVFKSIQSLKNVVKEGLLLLERSVLDIDPGMKAGPGVAVNSLADKAAIAEDLKAEKEADKKAAKKEAKEKAAAEAKVADVKVETKAEEAKVEAKAEVKVEAKVEETKEVPKEEKKKSRLSSVYARTNEIHKKVVGEILTKNFPGWDKPDRIGKAKTMSETLNGKEFLDGEGLVLQSFTDQLIALMK